MGRSATAAAIVLACAGIARAEDGIASRRGLDGFVTTDRLPIPEDPVLRTGRLVWGENCGGCHGGNKATGAPKITSTLAWEPRIEQGMAVLIDHALSGFVGPKYTQMPARGGNPELTDPEVAAAVGFMVWASGGAAAVRDYLTTTKGAGQ